MSEAGTVPSLMMTSNSIVSEESLARDTDIHTHTHTHTQTLASSNLNFFKVINDFEKEKENVDSFLVLHGLTFLSLPSTF